MNAQLLTHPAYDNWHPHEATDVSGDGNPDARIVPLVEYLRRRGIVTTHSCSGHAQVELPAEWGVNYPMDGYLAVLDHTVTPESVVDMLSGCFSSIEMHIWPEPMTIVFRWRWHSATEAMMRLRYLEPRKD